MLITYLLSIFFWGVYFYSDLDLAFLQHQIFKLKGGLEENITQSLF